MPLVIDAAAAAATPTDAELAAWARDQRVFISSVMADLADERRTAAATITTLGAEPVWFEAFGGRDDDPQGAYLAEVDSSHIYLGILARTYGRLLPSRLSATHEEYREAERGGLRISVWVHASEDFQGDQRTFVDEVRQFHTTGRYTSPTDLAAGITARLTRIAAEELSPWCKLGDSVFRARRISDTGNAITIDATVTAPAAVAALEALRPDAWVGKRKTRLTYRGRSHAARVKSVTTTTTTARTTSVEIALERARDLETNALSFSVSLNSNTYSADDITEINLRRALFGEPGPRGLLSMGGSIGDPLSELPTTPLPVELHRAVLGLLITEALIGSGHATHVTRLQIAPPGPGGRRIIVEWTGRADRGQTPDTRTVDGYLSA
ncbi:MAG: DUF4062 domain-containing protein [Actinomycetes bacterium]